MHNSLTHKALVGQIFRVLKKCFTLEKRNIVQFEGVSLYPSEIHLLLFLRQEEHRNVTHIAERLSMTKGAVSQTLARLEKKKMLRKRKDPYQKNEVSVTFTPLGQTVIEYFQQQQRLVGLRHDEYFSALTENDRHTIGHFLTHVEHILDSIGS